VEAGEVVGLFGRNGVGKTTVMKTVAGWVVPTSGSIRFDGAAIEGLPSDLICRMGLGFVPEDRRIFPGFTVEENLKLGFLQCLRRSKVESKRALEQAYARFPLLKERRKQVGVTLSGGEQQMLAIARVLVGTPRLLLIDEPTEGLAPMIVDEIFSTITSLRDEGIPILLVEQKVFRALDVSNRFYALERGQIVAQGEASSRGDRDALLNAVAL
jgi:branched-chain amino acid transport system ATP-binding protein